MKNFIFGVIATLLVSTTLMATSGPFPPWIQKITGDITIDEDGATSLKADAVASAADVADNAISLEHLDSGITASHHIVAAGEFTTAGGDTDETITVAGALATDICFVTLHTAGASPVTVVDAACGAGDIDVDMSADPSTDHVLSYLVTRPPS